MAQLSSLFHLAGNLGSDINAIRQERERKRLEAEDRLRRQQEEEARIRHQAAVDSLDAMRASTAKQQAETAALKAAIEDFKIKNPEKKPTNLNTVEGKKEFWEFIKDNEDMTVEEKVNAGHELFKSGTPKRTGEDFGKVYDSKTNTLVEYPRKSDGSLDLTKPTGARVPAPRFSRSGGSSGLTTRELQKEEIRLRQEYSKKLNALQKDYEKAVKESAPFDSVTKKDMMSEAQRELTAGRKQALLDYKTERALLYTKPSASGIPGLMDEDERGDDEATENKTAPTASDKPRLDSSGEIDESEAARLVKSGAYRYVYEGGQAVGIEKVPGKKK